MSRFVGLDQFRWVDVFVWVLALRREAYPTTRACLFFWLGPQEATFLRGYVSYSAGFPGPPSCSFGWLFQPQKHLKTMRGLRFLIPWVSSANPLARMALSLFNSHQDPHK